MTILENSNPLISIIVACFNAERTLEACMSSVTRVQKRHGSNVELIVVDGLSSDTSLSIVKNYASPEVKYISEKDSGVYDAMNKGIRMAKGDWLLFLGADDQLTDDFEKVFSYLKNQNDYLCVYADVLFDNGRKFVSRFNWRLLLWNSFHHQGALYSRKIFSAFPNIYDTQFKIASDYELNLLAYLGRMPFLKIEPVFCLVGTQGLSQTQKDTFRKETHLIKKKHIKGVEEKLLWVVTHIVFLGLDVTRPVRYFLRRRGKIL